MMAIPQRAIAVLGVGVDPRARDVALKFRGDDQRDFELRLAPETVASIAVTLFSLGRQIATSDDDAVTGQVMVLAGAIPARGPEREPVIDLVFPGGLHFPITFEEEMIQILENACATLRHTSIERTPPTGRRN
jgi:hypothetical protein